MHDVDLACNKALALAGRTETRDLIDILAWGRRYGIASIVWAACGKDPGFNPISLLEQMRRHGRIDPGQLSLLKARNLDPGSLKQEWLKASEEAAAALSVLADAQPELETGVVLLDRSGNWGWPDAAWPVVEQGFTVLRPTVGGCIGVVHLPD